MTKTELKTFVRFTVAGAAQVEQRIECGLAFLLPVELQHMNYVESTNFLDFTMKLQKNVA